MRRISTVLEMTLSATLLILGLYLLYEGGSDKLASGGGIALIGGAFCFTLGVMVLIVAVRSVIWHWQMLRQSAPNQPVAQRDRWGF